VTKFVVALEIRETRKEYFEIGPMYDPYGYYMRMRGTYTTPSREKAFQFETKAAAEVIAAMYCGRVEEVSDELRRVELRGPV